jgi:hypothetical protein
MDTTKNKMSNYSSIFFHKLSNYLDTKLYYFGSIQRSDYFPKSSDIDVDIFTDNIQSTINKMQSFLKLDKHSFKKFVYRLDKSNKIVHGYKIVYKEPENFLFVEFSIYNTLVKKDILEEHNRKIVLPYYISVLLIFFKFFYYSVPIIPKNVYLNIKKFLMDVCIDGKHVEFIVID